jgi:hypothetical protein
MTERELLELTDEALIALAWEQLITPDFRGVEEKARVLCEVLDRWRYDVCATWKLPKEGT